MLPNRPRLTGVAGEHMRPQRPAVQLLLVVCRRPVLARVRLGAWRMAQRVAQASQQPPRHHKHGFTAKHSPGAHCLRSTRPIGVDNSVIPTPRNTHAIRRAASAASSAATHRVVAVARATFERRAQGTKKQCADLFQASSSMLGLRPKQQEPQRCSCSCARAGNAAGTTALPSSAECRVGEQLAQAQLIQLASCCIRAHATTLHIRTVLPAD